MALFVNTNACSMNAQRMLSNSTTALDTSYKRLASGLRINSAKDDAAGMQISNRLTSQINGLEQGNRNAQDAISYAQTAEGAMDEMTTMYQRIRTLALQSANGTNSAEDRKALQNEVTQLCAEIDRITKDTTFAGEKILTGEKSTTTALGTAAAKDNYSRASAEVKFQVGADADQTISVKLGNKDANGNQLGFSVADVALSLGATEAVAITAAATSYLKTDDSGVSEGLVFNISTAESSQNVLKNIDSFIQCVDNKRAELGAVQNRLESTIRNQSNVAENVSDARSRIRDTDFATETANMTQTSIIQQASQSILSQANQRPQLALSLLR
jgi:flagellin